jgi:hypothetical protein
MSADIEIWNAGASQASVMRRAIVFRIWLSFTTSTSVGGAAAGAADGAARGLTCARSTSSATIRPSGPVPRSSAKSIPRSLAMRRASGDAFTRPPFTRCAGSLGPSGAASRPRSRSSSRSGASAGFSTPISSPPSSGSTRSGVSSSSGTSSPASPMTAIGFPTSISSPSFARIFSRTPLASASTSCVTFSVSSS